MSAPNYGIDIDRILPRESVGDAVRRRLAGRYTVDEFGGDAQLMDLLTPLAPLPVAVFGGEFIPREGPALLVASRSVGLLEPLAVARAVREAAGRRVRTVGAPELPVLGDAIRRIGAIGYRPDDVAAMLRAGHLAAAPLSATWFRRRTGYPPQRLLVATLGFPVLPVAVRAGFPAGLPGHPWRVRVGAPLRAPEGTLPGDELAAAELAEDVRNSVRALLVEEDG